MVSWIRAAKVTLVAVLGQFWGDMPDCPGLVLKPSPRPEGWLQDFASRLAAEVREGDAGKGYDLLFYGDSITETWRGTDMGRPCPRCACAPQVFHHYFGSRYRSEVLAVGGDQVSHLHWRLLHGEIPELHPPGAAVLMIGINDLGAAADCSGGDPDVITQAANGTFDRISGVIKLLKEQLPYTKIVLLGLLPRGEGRDWATTFQWPSRYTDAIRIINNQLGQTAATDPQLAFVDCGDVLLPNGTIEPELQGDGLHPTAAGLELVAQCLEPIVIEFLGQGASRSITSKFFLSLGALL